MPIPEDEGGPIILLTGGSGYVGGRLIPLLERRGGRLRCLARDPEKMRPRVRPTTEVVRGDVLDRPSLDEALRGVHTAYYLVHLMSGSKDFEREDRQAATNFAGAAQQAGVRRLVYLGAWATTPTRASRRTSAAATKSARSSVAPASRSSNSGPRWSSGRAACRSS